VTVIDGGLRAACLALAIGGLAATVVQAAEEQRSAAADPAKTGEPNSVLLSGTAHDALFGIAFDGDRGLAVGAIGEIQETADGGKTWKARGAPPTPLSLLGAGIAGEQRAAVGQQGLILLAQGQGAWTKVADSATTARLFAVGLNTSGVIAAVGAFGTVTVSADGGKSWQLATIDWNRFVKDEGVQPHLYDVLVDSQGVITIAGEFGLILRSADRGATWVELNRGDASLFDLAIRSDGAGYAVGQDGTVLTTADNGKSWTALPTGSKSVLLGVWSAPDGHVLITGMHTTLESHDGGRNWKTRSDADFATGWYAGVAGSASGALILVGNTGRIVRVDS
jgi:photosystem II stability/assembly factor-like uncharacterized protein